MEEEQVVIEREILRIQDEYARRAKHQSFIERYSLFHEATLLQFQGCERHSLALLKKHGLTQLADKDILDIGCGGGMQLQRFLAYGARPERLHGIDLLPARIEQARAMHPAINWHVGSAHQLPCTDDSFDLVMLSVVLSSILASSLRERIAAEAWRVCKAGGLILCYDFAYANPANPAVMGISQREILRLFDFPDAHCMIRRITLAPPLSRLVAPRARWLASALEHVKVFNTHLLCGISKV